jgi:predicted metal-dependent hydrolase
VSAEDQPTIAPLAGCDEPLCAEALAGVAAFNAGEYFEQHEHFELAWMAESRPIREMYQGILQVGVAFYQIERGNWRGAVKMFRRGLPRLRMLPDVCRGLQIAKLRTVAEAIHTEISELGPERLAEFDPRKFPKIEYS